jgi:hypothetical protein
MDGLTERELEQLIRLLRKLRLAAGDFDAAGGSAQSLEL